MELDKFARQLRLMELLTHNYQYSIEEVSEKLKMSKRSIYRYIDAFKSMGFVVRKAGSKYRLDHSSPFFQNITKDITFTEDEGLTLCEVLNSVYNNSVQIRYLREKLGRLYSTDVLAKHGVDNQVAQNISTIYQCIREERVALLKNYDSPSSGKVSDRVVEPYMFLNENAEVRCFELSSGMNKTFKLSRTEKVEKIDLLWSHKAEHKPFYADLFHFSSEERKPVSLLLGPLSTNLLIEEFPDSQRQLHLMPDGRHRFDTEVCSYKGIARFVLGLFDDIEIVDSPEFMNYIQQKVKAVGSKYAQAEEQ